MKFYNQEGKLIGQLTDGIYTSHRIQNQHFMRIFQGYGVSLSVLKELNSLGCRKVRIVTEETNGISVYECPIKQFLESEKVFKNTPSDKQHFVSVRDMGKIK